MARVSQELQEARVLLGLLAQQAFLDQQDLAASTAWLEQLESELSALPGLQDLWAMQDQQETERLVLPDLLEKGLSALQVQRELKALSALSRG